MNSNEIKIAIEALHQAQEMSERLILSQKEKDQKISSLEKRVNRLLELSAPHIDFTIEAIIEHPLKKNVRSTYIALENVEVNSQFFELLGISILSNKAGETTGIFLKVHDNTSSLGLNDSDEESLGLQLFLPEEKIGSDLAERISSFGTTDWNTVIAMFGLLKKLITEHTKELGRLKKHADKLLEYVDFQSARFSSWPATLRFDDVSSGIITHSESYHSLQIKIWNLSVGKKIHPYFEFNTSTVTGANGSFGSNPRLEFYENCKIAIENWYAESNNGNGERLELRLAPPNAIDTEVWSILSEADKLLVAGLIGRLPTIIEKISKTEPNASMRWADWCSLATDIRNIFVNNMVAQHSGTNLVRQSRSV